MFKTLWCVLLSLVIVESVGALSLRRPRLRGRLDSGRATGLVLLRLLLTLLLWCLHLGRHRQNQRLNCNPLSKIELYILL